MAESPMSRLHPALSGVFDLKLLLQYEPPKMWRPKEKGDRISGLCWKITDESFRRNGDFYDFKVLHLFDSDQKLWKLSCSTVSLKKQQQKLNIVVGQLVACTYLGTGETDEGRTYKKHKLERL